MLKNYASWLAIRDDAFTSPEQSDWCNNILIHLYNSAPVLPVNVSMQTLFFDAATGCICTCEEYLVWGQDCNTARLS